MEAERKKRYLITFLILILGVIAFLLLNICIGTVQIPLSELKNAVMDGDSKLGRIVLDIRAPRSFAAMILGGALALATDCRQEVIHELRVDFYTEEEYDPMPEQILKALEDAGIAVPEQTIVYDTNTRRICYSMKCEMAG